MSVIYKPLIPSSAIVFIKIEKEQVRDFTKCVLAAMTDSDGADSFTEAKSSCVHL